MVHEKTECIFGPSPHLEENQPPPPRLFSWMTLVVVTEEHLEELCGKRTFGSDNRAGMEGTLHIASAAFRAERE